jgi:hypothetical protein
MAIGRYTLVGPQATTGFAGGRLLLDTNVVIDVEHFYFRPNRDRAVVDDVAALLSEYQRLARQRPYGVEAVYGFGLAESAWKRGQVLDRVLFRRMKHAADTAFGWSADELADHLANPRPPVTRDKAWRSSAVPLPARPDTDGPATQLMPTYAALLHLRWLDSRRSSWKQKGGLHALDLYADWVCNTLGLFAAYEIQLGIDLLLGRDNRRNKARAFLKIGGGEPADTIADRCWNAAWDLFFLRSTESATFGLGDFRSMERKPTVLVTRDPDPGFVRELAQMQIADMWPSEPGSFIGFTWTEHTAAHADIDAVLRRHQADRGRESRPPAERAAMVLAATREAEAALGVNVSALQGTRWDTA